VTEEQQEALLAVLEEVAAQLALNGTVIGQLLERIEKLENAKPPAPYRPHGRMR